MSAEQQTEWIINNILVNNGWIIDEIPAKNVYFQKARPEHQWMLETVAKRTGYKKPDYILYHESNIIGVIEAKRGGESLEKALKQAIEYAEMLKAPLIFASNGAFVETYHLKEKSSLFINGEKVDKILKYQEAVALFVAETNTIYTINPELVRSKEELIKIFKNVNNLLRKANIFAGYDRISEFSSILFLKLISEQEGEKSYWNSIKKQDDDFLLSHLNDIVIGGLENKYGGGVFSEINIKRPALLKQVMSMIDPLVLSDIKSDIKGDAFEYFLKNMNQADNDLGQYFTPRHIVKAMVHLVKPKLQETVYDPFCGTGGFLIEAFNHIKENSIIKTKEDRDTLREHTLFGGDATKVATIAKKNMILHGDGHSNIEERDSLEHPKQKKMSIILTNIPFSLKDVDYTNLYYNGLGKKNGDAVCVLHCLDALEEGGRMAIIVPEGFLFKKQLKDVRKFLLSKVNLELVVSLPQGVFQPYTGVKTDILYFTNAHKPQPREGYYYFEVKNDGFTLDAHRRKIAGANDIHRLEASNIIKSEQEILIKQGFEFVPFEKVKNNDYNLVGSIYRELGKNSECNIVKLGEICSADWGNTNLTKEIYLKNGKYKVFSASGDDGLSNNFEHTGEAIILSAIGARCGKCFYAQEEWTAIKNTIVIKPLKNQKIILKYLFYILNNETFWSKKGGAQPFITLASARNQHLPLPSLSEQQKIVDELDSYQQVVDGTRQAVTSWKPYFEVDKSWSKVELGNVCEVNPKKVNIDEQLQVSFIDMFTMPIDGYKFLHSVIRSASEVKKGYTSFKENDLLLAKITPCFENGKCGIATNLKNGVGFGSTEFIVIRGNIDILPAYLYSIVASDAFRDEGKSFMQGTAGQKRVSIDFVKNYKISLPPLYIQQEIVEQLERERKMVESQREIINLFQDKITNKLNSLWQIKEKEELIANESLLH